MQLSPTYFGPVSWYRQLTNAITPVIIDSNERFVKQTERSRCRIATANGVQTLSVPVSYSNGAPVRDVRIAEHSNWRHTYWQALSSAYGSSPFFEYYADDIHPFFERRWEWLYDYNMEIVNTMCELIDIHPEILTEKAEILSEEAEILSEETEILTEKSEVRSKNPATIILSDEVSEQQRPYYQTFQHRHGFLPNLSILDLLFNLGPESLLHLKAISKS